MSSPGDTWAGVLLDGLVGGVIGGAATGAAVYLTFKFDRRHERERAVSDLAGELARKASLFAQDVAVERPGRTGMTRSEFARDWWLQYREIQTLSTDLWARLSDSSPGAADAVEAARAAVASILDKSKNEETLIFERQAALAEALGELAAVCMAWVTEPEQFKPLRWWMFTRRLRETRRRRPSGHELPEE